MNDYHLDALLCADELKIGKANAQNYEVGQLTEEETALVMAHRAKNARVVRRNKLALELLARAREYAVWLHEEGRGTSYSTFADEFGHEGGASFYESVFSIIKAAYALADEATE
jgi:hypothetical protein